MKIFYIPIASGAEGAPTIGSPEWFFLFGLCNVFLLIFISPVLVFLKNRFRRNESESLVCTRDELKIIRKKPATLKMNEIIALDALVTESDARSRSRKKKGLRLETASDEVTIGDYLERDEITWLREALLHLIVHGPVK